ncbi:MAG: NOB1 family endonuclease [Candidatus Bathycorpusculaceae bacterium]
MLTERKNRKVIVLDTSAFVVGFDPLSISEDQYTTPMVREEIIEGSMPWVRFKTAVESGKLKVRKPDKIFIEKVKATASTAGETFFMSETDLQVLALALQLKKSGYHPLIATDDYSIQNIANSIGIEFTSLATFGIRFQLKWIRYCPACHRKYPPDYKSKKCKICGTELKRKPLNKRYINI